MRRYFEITGAVLFFIFCLFSAGFSEDITITTYYPSPYGSYQELRTYGNTYLATDPGGQVGIGTTTPAAKLDVNGEIRLTIPVLGYGGDPVNYLPATRRLQRDIAEEISASDDVEAADVVVIDPATNERVTKTTKPYDILVAGIISTSPAFLITMPNGKTPLALAGRVLCKVTTQYGGPIKRGDFLVTSPKPGYAMKAVKLKSGAILGKALEPLDKGDAKIMVLLTLQ